MSKLKPVILLFVLSYFFMITQNQETTQAPADNSTVTSLEDEKANLSLVLDDQPKNIVIVSFNAPWETDEEIDETEETSEENKKVA